MLNTLIIIGRVESATQHDTRTGTRMTVYRVVTHSHERIADTGKYKDTVYHSVLAFGEAAGAAQGGDIVCVVGRVQLRKSTHNGAWEYSCVARHVSVLTEAQVRELEGESADFERRLNDKARKTRQVTQHVASVMSTPATAPAHTPAHTPAYTPAHAPTPTAADRDNGWWSR